MARRSEDAPTARKRGTIQRIAGGNILTLGLNFGNRLRKEKNEGNFSLDRKGERKPWNEGENENEKPKHLSDVEVKCPKKKRRKLATTSEAGHSDRREIDH
jgi:hypothetical protein